MFKSTDQLKDYQQPDEIFAKYALLVKSNKIALKIKKFKKKKKLSDRN